MQRPVHPSFGQVKPMWTGRNMGGRVKNGAKKSSKKPINTGSVSYALEVIVNGILRVFVVLFRSSDTF